MSLPIGFVIERDNPFDGRWLKATKTKSGWKLEARCDFCAQYGDGRFGENHIHPTSPESFPTQLQRIVREMTDVRT